MRSRTSRPHRGSRSIPGSRSWSPRSRSTCSVTACATFSTRARRARGAVLLDVQDLSVRFETDDGTVHAVDRMAFTLDEREVLGIVGESGCGKSVTAMSMLRLLPQTAVISGRAIFQGTDLLTLSDAKLRRVRGREIAFVFQEPMTSLNPVFTVG